MDTQLLLILVLTFVIHLVGTLAYAFRIAGIRTGHIAIAFNPADAASAIERGELPATVRTYIHEGGTIANVHFLAIPFNANAPEAAQVVANFLLSPEAQIRKSDPRIWGDPTVLAMHRLSKADRAAFAALPRGIATLSEADLDATLAEPHPSWMTAIETEWRRRYGSGT